MKKKLALLLAAVMTVAMVPATAFASTKLTAVDEITAAVDKRFVSKVELRKNNDQVDITTTYTYEKEGSEFDGLEVFDVYATLTNGKFYYVGDDSDNKLEMATLGTPEEEDSMIDAEGVAAVEKMSDTKIKVTLHADTFNKADGKLAEACVLPIVAKATAEGDVVVKFTSNVTAFKTASEVIATAVAGKVSVEVDGIRTFVEDSKTDRNTVKDITLTELTPDALTGNDITLKLKGNWEITEKPTVKFLNEAYLNDQVAVNVDDDDEEITISFNEGVNTEFEANIRTQMTITGLEIKTTKKCNSGDVATITVSSKDFSSVKLEVAKMVEEAVTYTVEDKDLPTIWAGKDYHEDDDTKTLKLSIEENTGDILNTSRKATFTFPEGIEVVDIDEGSLKGVKDDEFKYTIDQNVVTIYNYQKGEVESDSKVDMDIKFIINAAPTFTGDVEVTLGGQFDDVSFKVATVKAPYTIEAKTSEVLIDYRYVPVNNIVITEAEDGILDDDDVIVLAVEKMDFEDAGEVEVTEGDIDVDVTVDDDGRDKNIDLLGSKYDVTFLTVEVKDASTEASTIVISGLELYLDRTLPVGGYALYNVGGYFNEEDEAINILWENSSSDKDVYDYEYDSTDEDDSVSEGCGMFKYKDVTVNDSYVEVITQARDQDDSMLNKKVIITVGASTMAVGQETVTLDAPAYINSENFTMLPVRAISEAFGATVNWDATSRTVTILSGQRIISMTLGSRTMYINGTPVAMNTVAAVTNDRTFVPVRDLANALGISDINWTEASGTVTLN